MRASLSSQSRVEQAHIASALVFERSKVQTPHVRSAVVGHLLVIDPDLGLRVADGLGLAPPRASSTA
ncbi:Catalase C [compost metagenome]